jgi:hypothetical protein
LFVEVPAFGAVYPTERFSLTRILAEDERMDYNELRIEVTSDRGGIETGVSRSGKEGGRQRLWKQSIAVHRVVHPWAYRKPPVGVVTNDELLR